MGPKPHEKIFRVDPNVFILATLQMSHLRGYLKIRCHSKKKIHWVLAHNFLRTSYKHIEVRGKNWKKKSKLIFSGYTHTWYVPESQRLFTILSYLEFGFLVKNFSLVFWWLPICIHIGVRKKKLGQQVNVKFLRVDP